MLLPEERFTVKERQAYFRQFFGADADSDPDLQRRYTIVCRQFLRLTDEWGIPDCACTADVEYMYRDHGTWGKGYFVRQGDRLFVYCAHNISRLTSKRHEVLQYLGITLLEKRREWIMFVRDPKVTISVVQDGIAISLLKGTRMQGPLTITKTMTPLEILHQLKEWSVSWHKQFFTPEAFEKWRFRDLQAESELMLDTLNLLKDIDHTLVAIALLNVYDETEKLRRLTK